MNGSTSLRKFAYCWSSRKSSTIFKESGFCWNKFWTRSFLKSMFEEKNLRERKSEIFRYIETKRSWKEKKNKFHRWKFVNFYFFFELLLFFIREISLSEIFRTAPWNLPTEEKRIDPTSPRPIRFCLDFFSNFFLLRLLWKTSPRIRA